MCALYDIYYNEKRYFLNTASKAEPAFPSTHYYYCLMLSYKESSLHIEFTACDRVKILAPYVMNFKVSFSLEK